MRDLEDRGHAEVIAIEGDSYRLREAVTGDRPDPEGLLPDRDLDCLRSEPRAWTLFTDALQPDLGPGMLVIRY